MSYVVTVMGDNYRRKFHVRVYADSRGAWLGRELRRLNCDKYTFSVIYRRGACLIDIWEMIENDLIVGNLNIDFIFVYGGVCDLTVRYVNRFGRRTYWPQPNMSECFRRMKRMMSDMINNLGLIRPGLRLCFLPESGVDLITYNRIRHPVPWYLLIIQEEFEDRLRDLQWVTRIINSRMSVITPWSLETTHSRRSGRLVPVYGRSFDGLHPTIHQIRHMARILSVYVRNELV